MMAITARRVPEPGPGRKTEERSRTPAPATPVRRAEAAEMGGAAEAAATAGPEARVARAARVGPVVLAAAEAPGEAAAAVVLADRVGPVALAGAGERLPLPSAATTWTARGFWISA